ncbi:iron-containing alcohol dehydrogenase family protein [Gordonia mangrovi]|uniref:iron-containing alcohol dehydrogenase family protein n=1 Tax=Gordonia mangrovi TaxID=2665643 RepID=UPI00136FD55C|nr:iron-containing alcohol dehydrogenase [Gordonia mangrovi]UVF76676.1 iron-containing alcohol dehydrogenase [Gordonia mangrovi]
MAGKQTEPFGFGFAAPTSVISGLGAVANIPALVESLSPTRIAVVADRGVAEAGLLDRALDGVGSIGTVELVGVNPDVASCDLAAESALEAGCDAVIAVGGGSALGLAKGVALRLTNPGSILDYEGVGKAALAPAPSIAVPTTAGSGSEVSNALVLHEKGRPREVIVRGAGYAPDYAILDGQLLVGLPHAPMLYAALDALSHAFEAMWVKGRSLFTDALAEKAALTIFDVLPAALSSREEGLLQALLEASTAANLACGNSGLGLIHAMTCAPSVPLAHGYQNGALLKSVGDFNRPVMSPTHAALVDRLPQFFADIDWKGRFEESDLAGSDVDAIVVASTQHPFRNNNLRATCDDDIRAIVAAAHAN